MIVYTETQLSTLDRLGCAYGHWYGGLIHPADDVGLPQEQLLPLLSARASERGDLDGPCVVYGPHAPDGFHVTGSGRLRWAVGSDGNVMLAVTRPHPDVLAFRERVVENQLARDAWYGDPNPEREPAYVDPSDEPKLTGVVVISVYVRGYDDTLDPAPYPGLRGHVLHAEGHSVRHAHAMAEALTALGVPGPADLYADCPDVGDEAATILAKAQDLVDALKAAPAEVVVAARLWTALDRARGFAGGHR